MKIQRALISVSDKTGIVEFARALHEQGWKSFPPAAQPAACKAEGIPTVEVSQFTGSPEIMDGRVKTLHPEDPRRAAVSPRQRGARKAGQNPWHPPDRSGGGELFILFEATIAKEDVTLPEAIEQIDIGGPSMIRSASKNYQSVTVVTDPADYPAVLEDMKDEKGGTSLALRGAAGDQGLHQYRPPMTGRSRVI